MNSRAKPLSEAEAELLGASVARELGSGPGPDALASQRLRLAQLSLAAPTASLLSRQPWWAVGGGMFAAAVVVGGIVVVGKWRAAETVAQTRGGPGIFAEPLSESKRGVPDGRRSSLAPVQEDESNARSWAWQVASTSTSGGFQVIGKDEHLDAHNGPLTMELWSSQAQRRGGRLALARGARARVASVEASSLSVSLEQGRVDADMAEQGAAVVVMAGPFAVHSGEFGSSSASLGGNKHDVPSSPDGDGPSPAAYRVNWSPKSRSLRVEVIRGEVEVGLASEPERTVVGPGETLELDARVEAGKRQRPGRTPSSEDAEPSPVAPEPPAVDAPVIKGSSEEPGGDTVGATGLVGQTQEPPIDSGRWRKLAENGDYAAAVREAERVGFSGLEQSVSASDLLLLADTARLGGAPKKARSVLVSLRTRYPGHANASTAAFTLGRMAQEQEHDDRRAIQWYRTYLTEEPRGRMAEGARARLLKATMRVGSQSEQEQAARDYLSHHPTGSSASVARGVLSK